MKPLSYCLIVCLVFCSLFFRAQNYLVRSFLYNSFSGALIAAGGAMLNKKPSEKYKKVFLKGLLGGGVGGAVQFAGKWSVNLIAKKNEVGYGWGSRLIFSAGNSILENAAQNRNLFSSVHIDLAFLRIETDLKLQHPRVFLLPAQTGAFIFAAAFGRPDWLLSLRSGTFIFKTKQIRYAPYLVGSTTGNHFVLVDTLGTGKFFHEIFAHETIHAFQFLEFSGLNSWVTRPVTKWKETYPLIRKTGKYIHGDINYFAMLFNYFLIQGGYSRTYYCRNFLENEAELLSTGRMSCPNCGCN